MDWLNKIQLIKPLRYVIIQTVSWYRIIFLKAKLFDALMTTKLIEDPLKSNYSRCGRTDKGVSAFGQVERERDTSLMIEIIISSPLGCNN